MAKEEDPNIQFFNSEEIKEEKEENNIFYYLGFNRILSLVIGITYLVVSIFYGTENVLYILIFVLVSLVIIWFPGLTNSIGEGSNYWAISRGSFSNVTAPTPGFLLRFLWWIIFLVPAFMYILKTLVNISIF